jgi:hypothetical protein
MKDRDFPQPGNPFLSSQRSPRDSLEEPCPRCSGWLSAGFTHIQASSINQPIITSLREEKHNAAEFVQ